MPRKTKVTDRVEEREREEGDSGGKSARKLEGRVGLMSEKVVEGAER